MEIHDNNTWHIDGVPIVIMQIIYRCYDNDIFRSRIGIGVRNDDRPGLRNARMCTLRPSGETLGPVPSLGGPIYLLRFFFFFPIIINIIISDINNVSLVRINFTSVKKRPTGVSSLVLLLDYGMYEMLRQGQSNIASWHSCVFLLFKLSPRIGEYYRNGDFKTRRCCSTTISCLIPRVPRKNFKRDSKNRKRLIVLMVVFFFFLHYSWRLFFNIRQYRYADFFFYNLRENITSRLQIKRNNSVSIAFRSLALFEMNEK